MISQRNRHFQTLEIQPGASLEEIKRAYHDLVWVWHPDRFPNERLKQKAHKKLQEINEAYDQLMNYYTQVGEEAARNQSQGSQQSAYTHTWPNTDSAKAKPDGSSRSTSWQDPFDNIHPRRRRRSRRLYLYVAYVCIMILLIGILMFFLQGHVNDLDHYITSFQETRYSAGKVAETEEHSSQVPAIQNGSSSLPQQFAQTTSTKPDVDTGPHEIKLFTLGSSVDVIIEAQGAPDRIIKNRISNIDIWKYGKSEIKIASDSQTVIGWNNVENNLRVHFPHTGTEQTEEVILRGTHKDDVLLLQGQPERIVTYPDYGYEVWRYGYSSIIFSLTTNRVIGWNDVDRNLKRNL